MPLKFNFPALSGRLLRALGHGLAFGGTLALAAAPGLAAAQPAAPAKAAPSAGSGTPLVSGTSAREEPVVVTAARMDYDSESALVIAEGNVEVTQGDTIVLADSLTYDQKNDLVFAEGNVTVLEATGNVYFADSVELTDGMKRGVTSEFKARLADGSLFAARGASRLSEGVTELAQAVYSPCLVVCQDGVTPKSPTWQVRARKAVIDQNEQDVTYRDAYLDVYGVPVIYTPYFSHALPGADSESGLLAPEYRRDDNLGTVVKLPVYLALAPDYDMTITPMYTSEEGLVMIGEYRQRFDAGMMRFAGSVTRPDDRDAFGNKISGNTVRGHIFGDGIFPMDEQYQWGFNIRRTTDDTYLRRYSFNYDPLLTSRLYGEGFDYLKGTEIPDSGRNYAVAQVLAFQGIQLQNDSSRSPLVMPVIDTFYQSVPLIHNSRLSLSAGAMSLTRDEGADSRRLSLAGRFELPVVTESGHIFEFATQLRADGYDVDDHTLPGGAQFNGRESRLIPQAELTWRYPLLKRFETSSLIVEPVGQFIVSPNNGNDFTIPNEDSATPEFTDTNLFSANRFAGYDRVETGPRVNYGMRSQWQFGASKFISGLLGQAYRVNDDPLFPISSDLRSRFSDYVGRIGLTYAPFDIAYRFRLDKDEFSPRRSEVIGSYADGDLGLFANYLRIGKDPVLENKHELGTGATYRLTDNWSLLASAHRDLLRDDFVVINGGLTYVNECVTINTLAGKNYTSDRDFKPSTSFKVQVLLKNLN